jgi:hypothetical protein
VAGLKIRIDARATEIEAVEALVTDTSFDNATKMSRAIVTTVLKLLLERDWWVVAMRNGGQNLLYGMWPTEDAAQKAVAGGKLALEGEVAVFHVRSATARQEAAEGLDGYDPALCVGCDHAETWHGWKRKGVPGCIVAGCDCPKQYETE